MLLILHQSPDQESLTFTLQELTHHAIALGILVVASLVILLLTRLIVMPILRRIIKKTRFEWDDVLLDANTFKWLSYIPPAVVFALATQVLDSDYNPIAVTMRAAVVDVLQNVSQAFIVVCMLMAVNASLTAVNTIYQDKEASRSRPIKGFIQLGKIFVAVVGAICALAILFGEEPWGFLKYTTGMTAVLLFVFKDTILSLGASIQLTSNKMLQVGDWVEVPSCGADGDVIDVALHCVKVQNFDKTIVTVPTRLLVEGAFKNWRGMQESGGRRIKRDLNLDMSTIRFLDDADIERFGKMKMIRGYIEQKKKEVSESNKDVAGDTSPVDSRRLTNIGTFRAYITAYLKSIPKIHGEFTFLVRQLQPGQTGLPIQIYIFTNTTAWVEYEGIQSDIFDHLLAVLPEFGLRAFQQPTSHDVAAISASARASDRASDRATG